jgi:hypothetical protein
MKRNPLAVSDAVALVDFTIVCDTSVLARPGSLRGFGARARRVPPGPQEAGDRARRLVDTAHRARALGSIADPRDSIPFAAAGAQLSADKRRRVADQLAAMARVVQRLPGAVVVAGAV